MELAEALQEDQSQAGITESVGLLRKALIDDENSRAYRLLANSYYKQGKRPEADAMIAQAYFLEGDRETGAAVRQACANEAALGYAGMAEERRHHQLQTADVIAAAAKAQSRDSSFKRPRQCP